MTRGDSVVFFDGRLLFEEMFSLKRLVCYWEGGFDNFSSGIIL